MSKDAMKQSAVSVVWSRLTETEREVHRRAGYHRTFGLGEAPALLIIDVEYNFTGFEGQDTLESVDMYSNSCAETAWRAMPHLVALLDAARQAGLPVFYTHGTPADDRPGTPRRGTDIVDEIRPRAAETVIAKDAPSAFHGTGLAERLAALGVDTVIHAGTTTSGCVRASVVDAASYGFRNAVVEECVFDRGQFPHEANLFDMDAKYADVISLEKAIQYIAAARPATKAL